MGTSSINYNILYVFYSCPMLSGFEIRFLLPMVWCIQ